jgi:hypothetical protein
MGTSAAVALGASETASRPLLAYIGTFSSPLRDVLPTQVDLPPGNGRGIHRYSVDRETGALSALGSTDMGTSPSCLVVNEAGTHLYSANETDHVGENKEGTIRRDRHWTKEPRSGRLILKKDIGADQLREFHRRVLAICEKYKASTEPFDKSVSQVFKMMIEDGLSER